MTADEMPLMLDNAMSVDLNDVDDLFGDDVALSLPVRSQGKQFQQRLDELRSRGCGQAVAWSKSGTIASLTADGQTLQLRFLRCHPDNGSWDLSEPTTCELVKGTTAIPLVHLEWGATSCPELAVVDAVGRVALLSFPISLNHPYITRKWDADAVDDLNAVMGCYWLAVAPSNQQKPYNVMYGPANKQGSSYHYESSFVHAGGPSHPHSSKSALFCVTIGGMLKMIWSQNNNRMEETIVELESVNASDELVTHAALASDKKFLIIAVATTSLKLKLLKLEIQWGGPGSSSDKNPMPQNARLNPALVETHLASTSWLHSGSNEPSHDASMAELSHLQVLPSLLDNTGKSTVPPMIVTVRSRVPTEGSYQAAQSILDRWEAVEKRQNLHPAFDQLGNRRNSVSSELPNAMRLRKLDPIVIDKAVVGFQAIQFGKVLVLAMSDGTVEYRDRFTFDEVYAAEDLTKVMNLREVGWAYTDDGPCQQVAFSPTHCSMIQMGDDGQVRWSKLHYPMGDIGNSMREAHYAASIAGLAVTAASSMWYQSNYDDMLAIVQPFTSKKRFTQDWVSELIRILKIQVDYSEDTHHDALMRNVPLQACLSIMNSLGFGGNSRRRSFRSKFATLGLNVRNVVILITLASNTPMTVREKMNPLDEHEVVDALTGCAKWSLELLSWLTDCLFELMNDDNFTQRLIQPRFVQVTAYLHERNDVALHLLLCSSSRSFLSALCRRIALMEALSNKAIEFYRRQSATADQTGTGKLPNPQLQQAYQKMQQVTTSSLVNVTELEKLLNVLGSDVRLAYQNFLPAVIKKGPNAPQGKQVDVAIKTTQIQFEVGMLLAAPPPPAFLPVIKKLFSKDLPAFRAQTDPAKLFFANFDLLGVQDDDASLAARKAKGSYVDLFKKVELRPSTTGPQWKRCTRCASVMEDVFGSRPGFTFLLGQQRKCSCGGHWALLPKGKLVL
ncbi:Mediator of RNA polymerase II transcription subunit 16 [Tolypocladium ophioglossoides CBS 100239]|uniref:Mediator of RNA polymerase II transcription subunit 16 n=1 Tax=Tolypocladium ophioglossoides (strain CBS 100239) TaxID=1163406 RepID=A0A0L0N5Z6_TOLOC|nr:Mediator of RNA polymerase II transcription subunit 16 [Tolypocladium ophioglossoides CBS 100239]